MIAIDFAGTWNIPPAADGKPPPISNAHWGESRGWKILPMVLDRVEVRRA